MFDKEELRLAVGEPIYNQMRTELAPYVTDTPWRQDLCRGWTNRALPIVANLLDTVPLQVHRSDINMPVIHTYITIGDAGTDPLIADGTWQQFLPEDVVPSHPPVLLARESQIPKILSSAGVDAELADTWHPFLEPGYTTRYYDPRSY
jgi:hypothetical protein